MRVLLDTHTFLWLITDDDRDFRETLQVVFEIYQEAHDPPLIGMEHDRTDLLDQNS